MAASAKPDVVYSVVMEVLIDRTSNAVHGHSSMSMIRRLVGRYGARAAKLGLTVVSMATATVLLVGWSLAFGSRLALSDLVIINVVLAVLVWVVSDGLVGLIRELDSVEEALGSGAQVDPMTGAYTRSPFLELAKREWSRARRYQLPLSLVLLGVDDLQAVNTRYGSAVRDEVLVNLSVILRTSLRGSDLLAVFGQDQFAVLLPETGPDEALHVADRIRRAVQKAPRDVFGGATVSAGVSHARASTVDLDDLLQSAASALHSAQLEGRNRVVTFAAMQARLPA